MTGFRECRFLAHLCHIAAMMSGATGTSNPAPLSAAARRCAPRLTALVPDRNAGKRGELADVAVGAAMAARPI